MKSDHYLLRFLRAKNLNVAESKEMIIKAHRWRTENKTDTILEEKGQLLEVAKLLPFESGTFGFQHIPVIAVRIGEWKLWQLDLAGKSALVHRCIAPYLEFSSQATREASKSSGKNVTDFHFIADLNGFTTREHACLPFYYELFSTYENYYPRLFNTATMINTPKVFQRLLELIRPLFSKQN